MPQILGPWTLLDLAVVVGIAVVLPLALLGAWRAWAVVALTTSLALASDPGALSAVLAAPGVALAAWFAAIYVLVARWPASVVAAARLVAHAYSIVAMAWLVITSAGWTPLGIDEPIVELTAVHFLYAGVGSLVLAARTFEARRGRLALAAVTLTAAAPPIVAIGFATGLAIPQVGGAIAMTAGVWCTALVLLTSVRGTVNAMARTLLLVSGLAVWLPMVLAVAWAAAQHWNVPAMSIPDMARTHGMLNGLGFVIAGLAATRPTVRSATWS